MKKILKSTLGRKFAYSYLICTLVYFVGIIIYASTMEGWGILGLGSIFFYTLMPSYQLFYWLSDVLHETGIMIEFIFPILLNCYLAYLIGFFIEKSKQVKFK